MVALMKMAQSEEAQHTHTSMIASTHKPIRVGPSSLQKNLQCKCDRRTLPTWIVRIQHIASLTTWTKRSSRRTSMTRLIVSARETKSWAAGRTSRTLSLSGRTLTRRSRTFASRERSTQQIEASTKQTRDSEAPASPLFATTLRRACPCTRPCKTSRWVTARLTLKVAWAL